MSNNIKIKRGLKAGLPNLEVGEFGLATDTNEVFIGTQTGNELVNSGGEGDLSNYYDKSEINTLLNNRATKTEFNAHKNDKDNPHEVTKEQIGLGNVTNDKQFTREEFDKLDLIGGKNLAGPDLDGKEYLGGGVYDMFTSWNTNVKYNVYNGFISYQLSGGELSSTLNIFNLNIYLEKDEVITISLLQDIGLIAYTLRPINNPSSLLFPLTGDINKTVIIPETGYYFIGVYEFGQSTKSFKFQLEKGLTATPYTLPIQPIIYHELTSGEWITPTLLNGWSNVASNELQYRKDINGNVRLRGHLNGGTLNTTIATLPAVFRPLKTTYFVCSTGSTIGSGTISPNGDITLIQGDLTNVRLDNISFSTL